MTERPTEINPLIVNVQKALIDLIEFTKKRQWAITNYSVLIYVAIFGVAHTFGSSIRTSEKVGLSFLVGLTLATAIFLLIQIQSDAGRYRDRLEKLYTKLLSKDELKLIGFEPYTNPALRGVRFLAALIGVVVMGAGLVIYSILRT